MSDIERLREARTEIAELQSRLATSELMLGQRTEQVQARIGELKKAEAMIDGLESRLGSAIEIRHHTGKKFRYSLKWRTGACVGETLSQALQTMSGLMQKYNPDDVIEGGDDYPRIGPINPVVERRDPKLLDDGTHWHIFDAQGWCPCGVHEASIVVEKRAQIAPQEERCDNTPCCRRAGHSGPCSSYRLEGE